MPKQPQAAFESVYAFAPNRDTLGGTAYLIVENDADGAANILVDCPPWHGETEDFLARHGGVRWLVITQRRAIAHVQPLCDRFGARVILQEQEAYLLPNLPVESFAQERMISPHTQVIWTPGHSPGSSCVYCQREGGILFSGRHLLPNPQGELTLVKSVNTFHWPRQIRSAAALRDRFSPDTLRWICPGANTGFLRGRHALDRAHDRLAHLTVLSHPLPTLG